MTITALTQLDLGASAAVCEGWTAVPAAHVAQIVVTASPSPSCNAGAYRLFDALRMAMRAGGARPATPACGGSLPLRASGCRAIVQAGPVRRILVWVADGIASVPPADPTLACWDGVLALLPSGSDVSCLPLTLHSKVAKFVPPARIETAVPDALALAGIIRDGFRVFISYRSDDCQAFAEQLFQALAKQQYDVYLDRFRTQPGHDFAERIRHGLAEMACVVVLDSARVDQSLWVRTEHAMARQHRLGLFAIDLPGGNRHFATISRRIDLSTSFNATTFGRNTRLPERVVDQAVEGIRAHYFSEIARRPRYQRQILQAAAKAAGTPVQFQADSLAAVGSKPAYLISAQARPPRTGHFRELSSAAQTAVARPVMVGLLDEQLQPARIDCDWLAARIGGVAVDERRLFSAFKRIQRGKL